jgi:hypothetical protein
VDRRLLFVITVALLATSVVACGSVTPTTAGPGGDSSQLLAKSVQSDFKARFGTGPFVVTQIEVTSNPGSARILSATLRVPSVAEANRTIDEVMLWFETAVASLNREKDAKLGALVVSIKTPGGENVVDWTDDLVTGIATGQWAPGITNYWFPHPDTTASS